MSAVVGLVQSVPALSKICAEQRNRKFIGYVLKALFLCFYLSGFADRLPEGQRGVLERALPHYPDGSPRPGLSPRRHPGTQGRTQAFYCSQVHNVCECIIISVTRINSETDSILHVPFCVLGTLRARMCF